MDNKTEKKEAYEDLELLKHAIVRNVSHELVTPTQQAKAALALLRDEQGESDTLNWAVHAIKRLELIIDNLTQLMETRALHPEATRLRETVHYALESLGPYWGEALLKERVISEIHRNTPTVYSDKQGMETVLRILLDNALKFSAGRVFIRAKTTDDSVEISVIDCGIGMDLAESQAIFEPFIQMDDTSTRHYGGIGVGLAIAQKILANHDICLEVESERGKGSRFFFLLPIIDGYTVG